MNIWVEYWKYEDKRNNTHAQMKEQAHWVDPNPEDIRRRFFDKREDASNFAQRMQEDGHMTRIRTDGI